jgi:hypothetical protein
MAGVKGPGGPRRWGSPYDAERLFGFTGNRVWLMLRRDEWWKSSSAGKLKALLEQVDPSHQVAVSQVDDLVVLDGAGGFEGSLPLSRFRLPTEAFDAATDGAR